MLQPLDYKGHGIPEDLGESLIKSVPGVKAQPMPFETSSPGPAPAAQPGAVPAVQAAAGGSRTQDMVTLSWMLPAPAEKPPGVGSLSVHICPMQSVDTSQVSPQFITLERCWCPYLGLGFVLNVKEGKTVKKEEWECVGMACF